MPLEMFIARYGLAAVCLGAGIEGETVVMAGGVAAREHVLALPAVAIAAALGSFLADQGFFAAGRHFRDRRMVRKALAKPPAHRAMALLEHYPNRFILSIRFLYGIRTLSPIAVGASKIGRTRFMALNGLAAVFWGLLFTGIGYMLGDDVKALFRHMHPRGAYLLGALAAVVLALLLFRLACRRFHHGGRALPSRGSP